MKTTITITHKINNKNSSKTMRVYELRAAKLSANNHKKNSATTTTTQQYSYPGKAGSQLLLLE